LVPLIPWDFSSFLSSSLRNFSRPCASRIKLALRTQLKQSPGLDNLNRFGSILIFVTSHALCDQRWRTRGGVGAGWREVAAWSRATRRRLSRWTRALRRRLRRWSKEAVDNSMWGFFFLGFLPDLGILYTNLFGLLPDSEKVQGSFCKIVERESHTAYSISVCNYFVGVTEIRRELSNRTSTSSDKGSCEGKQRRYQTLFTT
jgi:hypothetical protein